MADANPYSAYSDPKLYQDANGKGAVIGTVPVADPTTAKRNKATLRSPDVEVGAPVKEDADVQEVDYLESLFNGEELSEEFKQKAATIFEAAINEKVSLIEGHILEAAKEIIQEQTEAAKEVIAESNQNLTEQLDGYLDYVISEWMEENKVAVEKGLRTEIAENFIMGLKELFENSFIDVPQEKYDVLDDIYAANDELQENVNTLIKENMELKNEITARLCAEAFMEEAAGLADTQVEKLAKLAEGVEFENVDQYRQKVALLKESYFTNKTAPVQTRTFTQTMVPLSEDASMVSTDSTQNGSDPLMESVVNTISMMNKNRPKVEKVIEEKTAAARVAALINPNISKDKFV